MMFDPLNNDYFDLIPYDWSTIENEKQNRSWFYVDKGPKLEICDDERVISTAD